MTPPAELSHVSPEGHSRMVDTSAKVETRRVAVARGLVRLSPGTLPRVLSGDLPKGPVFEVARAAAILGAKRTPDLIPMCHPLRITDVQVRFEPQGERTLLVEATVAAVDRTGVEMEALTAVAVAALTVYDMVKAVDPATVIADLALVSKTGGKSSGPGPAP
jgi:cyclic pyranopterin phosphate synthase